MARRKKYIAEQDNHERWLVSYADFITLLFAFFVVMYSVSSVNVGKYKILSNSLNDAFSKQKNDQAEKGFIQTENMIQSNHAPTTIEPIQLQYFITEEKQKSVEISDEILHERRRLRRAADQFEAVLEPYIDQDLVAVKRHDLWVELEMKSNMLFSSGEAQLSVRASPVLKKVAEIIRQTKNVMHVEGHTDNIPIDTLEFPSNWDLSAARASSVVSELVKNGINPARLAAVGYGEFHPVAENKLEEGRFKNRRVALVLLSQSLTRHGVQDSEREKLLSSRSKSVSNGTLR
jgi:chemotaxis protein MotB